MMRHTSRCAGRRADILRAAAAAAVFFGLCGGLHAWPVTAQWIPIYKGGIVLQDLNGDAQGSRNVVSDATHAALHVFNDGTYLYFRMRLDQDPTGTGGQGYLQSFGWGVEFDTNMNNADYEWVIMVDGITKVENIALRQNTVQGTLGDPSDTSELLNQSYTLPGNYVISPADTAINGDPDYFLDFRFPYDVLKAATNLTDNYPIRVFAGSSSSANNLTENGADLIGGSDLYSGFSDFMTPFGTMPTTGTVRFVDAGWTNDVTQIAAGQTVYIRVEDADLNYDVLSAQTVSVRLTSNTDGETVVLTETGPNTGVFTGSIPTTYAVATMNNGILQLQWNESVLVTYIDAIDAALNLNRPRTDTLTVLQPNVAVTKSATPSSVTAGGTVTYTLTISNTGTAAATVTQIVDTLPAGFSYVAGSTSGLTTADPTVGTPLLTWSGSWSVPVSGSVTLQFRAAAGSTKGTFYNNAVVSGGNFPQVATGDTAPVTVGAPLLAIAKTVDRAAAAPGDELVYTIHYRNTGDGTATVVVIVDTIPTYTSYVADSLRLGTASETWATAGTVLTDGDDGDAGRFASPNVIFTIPSLQSDDSVPLSGADEGKVFFKVRVN